MTINIGNLIYSALSSIITVQPIALRLGQGESLTDHTPYCVYQQTGCQPQYTKNLFTGLVVHYYELQVVSPSYDDLCQKVQDIADAMLSLSHTSGIGQVQLTNSVETFDEDLYINNLSFTISKQE